MSDQEHYGQAMHDFIAATQPDQPGIPASYAELVAERDALQEENDKLRHRLDTTVTWEALKADRDALREELAEVTKEWTDLAERNDSLREELERVRSAVTCPSGCGCEFPFDPTDCACDGACVSIEWATLQQLLEPSLPERND